MNLGRKEIEEMDVFISKEWKINFTITEFLIEKDNSLLNWNTIQQDHEEILRNGILQFKNNKSYPLERCNFIQTHQVFIYS